MTQHLSPRDRTRQLLDVAVNLAAAGGMGVLTREAVASAAGVSPALVSARLGTMAEMRRSVMRHAVNRRVVRVVAEGLVAGDRHAARADESLRQECAAWVLR